MSTILNQWEEIQTRENIMVLLDSVAILGLVLVERGDPFMCNVQEEEKNITQCILEAHELT